MTNRIRNSLLIIYCICVAAFVVLKISGYSFRIPMLNTLLLIIVLSYPIIRFSLASYATWIKLVIVISLMGGILLVTTNVLSLFAFSKEEVKLVQEWKFLNSKVVLTKRHGWAGPPYFRYDLIRFQLFNTLEKSVAFGYPPEPGVDSCLISFSEGEESKQRFVFDKCKKNLYQKEIDGR